MTAVYRERLALIASILLRCLLFSMALLLLWVVALVFFAEATYQLQVRFFDLTRHEFTVFGYWFLGITKILMLLFFLMPYLAIRHMLCCQK